MQIRQFRRFAWLPAMLAAGLAVIGCSGGNAGPAAFLGSPFLYTRTAAGGSAPGQTATGGSQANNVGGIGEADLDACSVADSQKFIRISMRNLARQDYIHYFLVLIAFRQTDANPDGAVCDSDVQLYTSNGYQEVTEADGRSFGNICLPQGTLFYYHEMGNFSKGGSTGSTPTLASAIAPSNGTDPTYDTFFNAAGAQLPVPNWILFHNPGTGGGGNLLISRPQADPCLGFVIGGNIQGACAQDAFYYVDARDTMTGSSALGVGSGRRVPNEIQGTGCSCGLGSIPYAQLALTARPQCNEFTRASTIDFVFLRDDRQPAFPQLVWRVSRAGSILDGHDFDSRSGVK